ncbi:transcriptional regulator, partial [Pseudoalteromonas ruthenica]
GGHNFIQSAVADFLSTGKYRQHLRRAQKMYQENTLQICKLIRQALDSHCVLKGSYQLTMP